MVESPTICIQCPCDELSVVKDELKAIRMKVNRFLDQLVDIFDSPEGVKYTLHDIERLDNRINRLSSSLSQVSAVSTTGSWGIVNQRADVIYSRLLTSGNGNGNGKMPYLNTTDVKKILGVSNYSQAKKAMIVCTQRHIDTTILERGQRKTGITLLKEVRQKQL